MANEDRDPTKKGPTGRGESMSNGDSTPSSAKPAGTGGSKSYSRPTRDSNAAPRSSGGGNAPQRSSQSRPHSSSSRPQSSSAPSRPQSSGASSRQESSRGSGDASRGKSSGYQGRPDRSGSDRGAPRRDNDSKSQGAFRGKGAPQRDGDDRPPRNEGLVRKAPVAPDIPDEVTFDQLDKGARARLRTLSKDNAEDVGRHLIMAGRLLDIDPERAYQHAQVAVARGGRVDIVREAAALTAYASGRYADALREFRTVRRLNGSSEHLALMADCERGLGRPERAVALAQEPEAKSLDAAAAVELQIVVAGARMDMGNGDAALMTLSRIVTKDPSAVARIAEAKAVVLRSLGRDAEADALEASLPSTSGDEPTWADEVFLYDTEELPEPVVLPEPEELPAPAPLAADASAANETSTPEDKND